MTAVLWVIVAVLLANFGIGAYLLSLLRSQNDKQAKLLTETAAIRQQLDAVGSQLKSQDATLVDLNSTARAIHDRLDSVASDVEAVKRVGERTAQGILRLETEVATTQSSLQIIQHCIANIEAGSEVIDSRLGNLDSKIDSLDEILVSQSSARIADRGEDKEEFAGLCNSVGELRASVELALATHTAPLLSLDQRLSGVSFEQFLQQPTLLSVSDDDSRLLLEKVSDVTSELAATTSLGMTLSSRFAAFTPHVEAAVRSGAAELMVSKGQDLAVAVQGGRTLGLARLVGPNAVQIACQGWLILVTGAHLISSHELAKSSKRIERGVVRLADIHDADKLARLEMCFEALRWTPRPLANNAKTNCRTTIGELRELRMGWRNLLEKEFLRIQEPTWVQAVLYPEKSTGEASSEVQKLEALLDRIEAAFHLEAIALPMLDEELLVRAFLTLAFEESQRFENLASLLEKKWNESRTRARHEAPGMIVRLRNLSERYATSAKVALALTGEAMLIQEAKG